MRLTFVTRNFIHSSITFIRILFLLLLLFWLLCCWYLHVLCFPTLHCILVGVPCIRLEPQLFWLVLDVSLAPSLLSFACCFLFIMFVCLFDVCVCVRVCPLLLSSFSWFLFLFLTLIVAFVRTFLDAGGFVAACQYWHRPFRMPVAVSLLVRTALALKSSIPDNSGCRSLCRCLSVQL